ncbi:hypothetical protein [Bacillus suaedae]|uniref:UPF0738 protein J7W16_00095 n=1 Tax=Halalkalibacter suaedae TaxID=2822140 RepID=A0A941ALL0_9BACI|nr:hypothetical protein [Bacillus suaedae]MBP3949510.1 hypothetical protein [Bacillus suaedae]
MKKLYVTQIKDGNPYIAEIAETLDLQITEQLKAGDRMLVDSDHLHFIYILEDETEFYYVMLSQETWPQLKKFREEEAEFVLLLANDYKLTLTNLREELNYLVDNIEGNGNYGEKMEKAVQELFLS